MTQCEDEGNATELSTVLSNIRILYLLSKMSVGGGKVGLGCETKWSFKEIINRIDQPGLLWKAQHVLGLFFSCS